MNYQKHYNLLIEKAKNRILEGYIECHHIVPKCFGRSDDFDNIVKLSAREHFIAHLLLYKIQIEKRKKYQMLKACIMMAGKEKFNSKLYEQAKKEFSSLHAERISGENHPMYGTSRKGSDNPFYGKTHSEETKRKLSKAREGMVVAKDIETGKCTWVTDEEFESENYVGLTSGIKVSDETKRKISEGLQNRPILKCPHCNKEGKFNMKRYHFDNCKSKL